MKFLIDAMLPKKLSQFLTDSGYDSIHSLDLPKKNTTSDNILNNISINQERILITKDEDFVNDFILKNEPYKLIHITTGNIPNRNLLDLITNNLPEIINLISIHRYIEIDETDIITHM